MWAGTGIGEVRSACDMIGKTKCVREDDYIQEECLRQVQSILSCNAPEFTLARSTATTLNLVGSPVRMKP